MAVPFLVASLKALRTEINQTYPNRDKSSDGWIGDAAHAATNSDHNPDGNGAVHALDIDEDLLGGGMGQALMMDLVNKWVRERDPRVKYIIYEDWIWRSYDKPGLPAWTPQRYGGLNAHMHHCHVSVLSTWVGENDVTSWLAPKGTAPTQRPTEDEDMWIHSSQWTGQSLVDGDTITWIDSSPEVANLARQGVKVVTFVDESTARRVIEERSNVRDDLARIEFRLAAIQQSVTGSH